MPDTALTVGVGLMVMDCVAVVVPHSLVTARLIVWEPLLLNITLPGVDVFALEGLPPLNCQLYKDIVPPQDKIVAVGLIDCPSQMDVIGLIENCGFIFTVIV